MKSPFSHITAAFVLCIVAIVGYGMWYATISTKSAAVASLQNQIDTKTETVNRIAATRATLADVASDEATVQSYFVPEAGVVSFIDSLETHGKALGASMNVLSVSTSGTVAQPTLAFTLTAKGTFDAVMRTVGSIEYSPYDLSITALTIVQDDKNSWHADLKLSVGSVPATRAATSTLKVSSVTAIIPSSPAYAYF